MEIIIIFLYIVISIVAFIVGRLLILWYFKIDTSIKLQRQILQELKKINKTLDKELYLKNLTEINPNKNFHTHK